MTTNGDADPAAEFLAREQETLAGLVEDNLNLSTTSTSRGATEDGYEVVNGDGTSTTHQVNPFEDSSADIDSSAVTMHDIDDQSSSGLPLDTTDTMSTTSSVGSSDSSKPEPEKIRIWREAHEKMLKTKDEEEAVKKEELKHSAKKELEEWYTRYAEQLEKSKKANREACKNAEKEWIAERDQKEEPGQEWEKIAKMCDFNPKSAKNSKDTTRLRSILLQLKQSPPAVDGTN